MRGVIFHIDNNFKHDVRPFGAILLHQIGELYCAPGYEVAPHRQQCCEITYIKSGEGTMYTDGIATHVHANDIYVSNNRCEHAIYADGVVPLKFLYMGYDLLDTKVNRDEKLLDAKRYLDRMTVPCMQDRCGIGALMEKALQEFSGEQVCFSEVVTLYLQLIVYLTYRNANIRMAALARPAPRVNNVGATVSRITRYVDDNIHTIGSIREIADKLNYNYSYISHLFKKSTGITLQQHIIQKKMEKALILLEEDRLTVAQTAECLGYKSAQAFNKVFRSVYGASPTTYTKDDKNGRNAP